MRSVVKSWCFVAVTGHRDRCWLLDINAQFERELWARGFFTVEGTSTKTDVLDPQPTEPGFWVWEGEFVGGECNSELDGDWRRATREEIEAFAAGRLQTPHPKQRGDHASTPRPIIVHLLHYGRALCGKEGPPSEWPDETWVDVRHREEATCDRCRVAVNSAPAFPERKPT